MNASLPIFDRIRRNLAVVVVGVASFAAGPSCCIAAGSKISRPTGPAVLGVWTYTALADGTFAAFADGGRAVVESRWDGPKSLLLGNKIFPFPEPLTKPSAAVSKYDPGGVISSNRKLFATQERRLGARNWRIYVWNLARAHRSPVAMLGRARQPRMADLAFSPSGRLIASIGWLPRSSQAAVLLHDVPSGKIYRAFPLPQKTGDRNSISGVIFTSARTVACAVCGKTVDLMNWDVASSHVRYSTQVNNIVDVEAMAACRERHELLISGPAPHRTDCPMIVLLNAATGRTVKTLVVDKQGAFSSHHMQGQDISHICVASDGRYAVATEFGLPNNEGLGDSSAGRFVIIALSRMAIVYRSPVIAKEALWYVDISPSGKRLLIAGNTRVYLLRSPFKL